MSAPLRAGRNCDSGPGQPKAAQKCSRALLHEPRTHEYRARAPTLGPRAHLDAPADAAHPDAGHCPRQRLAARGAAPGVLALVAAAVSAPVDVLGAALKGAHRGRPPFARRGRSGGPPGPEESAFAPGKRSQRSASVHVVSPHRWSPVCPSGSAHPYRHMPSTRLARHLLLRSKMLTCAPA
jgi:hypothetical protein